MRKTLASAAAAIVVAAPEGHMKIDGLDIPIISLGPAEVPDTRADYKLKPYERQTGWTNPMQVNEKKLARRRAKNKARRKTRSRK